MRGYKMSVYGNVHNVVLIHTSLQGFTSQYQKFEKNLLSKHYKSRLFDSI